MADLLPHLLSSDPTAPRIVWYDRSTGPGHGERIELSGTVLANWVAKAASALVDELGAGPGSRVELDLPPHWRAAYWALAAWTVGATLVDEDADLVITDDAGRADADVVVTLAALARRSPQPVPPGVMDEAAELAGQPDRLSSRPIAPTSAVDGGAGTGRPAAIAGWPGVAADRIVAGSVGRELGGFLDLVVGCWARGGAAVVVALTGEREHGVRVTSRHDPEDFSDTLGEIAAQERAGAVQLL